MALPDPHRSRAVLVGISDYAHADLAAMPAADAGAEHLARLLRDPSVWGLPQEHVTVLGRGTTQERVLTTVRDAALATQDTLVVYFAGHGLRDPGERLHLALLDADPDYPQIGTLPYRQLRDLIRHAGHRAKHRVTVLDCCYSGIAGSMSGAAAPTRDVLATALDEHGDAHAAGGSGSGEDEYGDCVLASAPPQSRSFVRPGATLPEFTGELVATLESGIAGVGPVITLERAWLRIRDRMRSRGSPEPQLFAQNKATHHIHFHNRAPHTGGEQDSDASDPGQTPGPGPSQGFLAARDAAERAARAVPDAYTGMSCLADLAVATVTADPAGAGRLADEVIRRSPAVPDATRGALLLAKVAVCLATLDPPRARPLVDEAERTILAVADAVDRVTALVRLATPVAAIDRERATWLLGEAEDAAHRIPDLRKKSSAFRTVSYSGLLEDSPKWRQRLRDEAEECWNDATRQREFDEAARVSAEGAAEAGAVEEMVKRPLDQFWKVGSLVRIAKELVGSGHHHQAVELLEEAERTIRKVDRRERGKALSELALALHQCVGKGAARTIPDRVLDLTARVRHAVDGLADDARADRLADVAQTLTKVAWQLADADPPRAVGLIREARGLASQPDTSRLRQHTFEGSLARALTRVGKALAPLDAEQAVAFAREAHDIVRKQPKHLQDVAGEAVSTLAWAGRSLAPAAPGRAEELLRDSEALAQTLREPQRENALLHISRAMSAAARAIGRADPERVDVLAREAERVARGLPEERRGFALSEIAHALIETGKALADSDPGLAADYAREAERLARRDSAEPRDRSLVEIVLLQSELAPRRPAYADRARRTADRITDDDQRAYALWHLAKALAPADTEAAERITQAISKPDLRALALTEIAKAWL